MEKVALDELGLSGTIQLPFGRHVGREMQIRYFSLLPCSLIVHNDGPCETDNSGRQEIDNSNWPYGPYLTFRHVRLSTNTFARL